jgi:hypothetical protein
LKYLVFPVSAGFAHKARPQAFVRPVGPGYAQNLKAYRVQRQSGQTNQSPGTAIKDQIVTQPAARILDDGKEFLRLSTLADVRDFLRRAPKERRQFDSWQTVERRAYMLQRPAAASITC